MLGCEGFKYRKEEDQLVIAAESELSGLMGYAKSFKGGPEKDCCR